VNSCPWKSRLAKIRAAKADLEAEAKREAEQQKAEAEAKIAQRRQQEEKTGKKARGRDPQVPDPEKAEVDEKAQRNFTDPESRIMPDGAHKGRSSWRATPSTRAKTNNTGADAGAGGREPGSPASGRQRR